MTTRNAPSRAAGIVLDRATIRALELGDGALACAQLEDARERLHAVGDVRHEALVQTLLAAARGFAGQLDGAEVALAEAARLGEAGDDARLPPCLRLTRACLAALRAWAIEEQRPGEARRLRHRARRTLRTYAAADRRDAQAGRAEAVAEYAAISVGLLERALASRPAARPVAAGRRGHPRR